MPGIIWIAVIGLIAGFIARFLLPGPNNPPGFLVTMVLGIAGAFVASARFQGRRVAIVDDVLTTGATVGAVAAALRQAGATSVDAWCVARTAHQERLDLGPRP